MTLQEAIQMADQGNVSAMMAVGKYYMDQNDYFEALKYLELAGEAGVGVAMLLSMPIRSILAAATRDMTDWEGTIKHCEKCNYWAQFVLNFRQTSDADMFTPKDYDMAYKYYVDSLCLGGMAYYFTEDFNAALEASKGLETLRLQLLHANALFQTVESVDDLKQAFEELKILESPEFQRPDDCNKYDENMIVTAAETLALFYREGLDSAPDIERAFRVLERIDGVIQTPVQKKRLAEDLAHYRKKLFGGYTYVE